MTHLVVFEDLIGLEDEGKRTLRFGHMNKEIYYLGVSIYPISDY